MIRRAQTVSTGTCATLLMHMRLAQATAALRQQAAAEALIDAARARKAAAVPRTGCRPDSHEAAA